MKFLPEQERLFWHWINERHNIYLKRRARVSPPWTNDEILRTYKFTNVFRQLDRVTVELNKRTREIDDPVALFRRIVIFRMFNWPQTYDVLIPFIDTWSAARATKAVHAAKLDKVFTGAYIITSAGQTGDKVRLICNAITVMLKNDKQIVKELQEYRSMKIAVDILSKYPLVGKFVAYELACDFRYTPILNKARDVLAWANPGPGAMRGIRRLLTGQPLPTSGVRVDYIAAMQHLLAHSERRKKGYVPRLEMREIEHSLCEFDKYMRVKNSEGRPRSLFHPKES